MSHQEREQRLSSNRQIPSLEERAEKHRDKIDSILVAHNYLDANSVKELRKKTLPSPYCRAGTAADLLKDRDPDIGLESAGQLLNQLSKQDRKQSQQERWTKNEEYLEGEPPEEETRVYVDEADETGRIGSFYHRIGEGTRMLKHYGALEQTLLPQPPEE